MPPAPRETRRTRRERPLPLGAPVRAWALAEWALLPLRLFLGLTFIYAALEKLSNPNFFNAKSPISIQQQLVASVRVSPVHSLLAHMVGAAVPIGIAISLGELAIGVGALLGLWTRVAALGGAILSFTLFLTVSFHATPYFTGADIVFFFAWMPLIIAGGGTRLSLDARVAKRAAAKSQLSSPELVPIPFARVQEMCGQYSKGRCALRNGLDCDAAVCPVLLGPRAPLTTRVAIDGVDRRALVAGATTALAVGVGTAFAAGAVAGVSRLIGRAAPPSAGNTIGGSTTTTTSAPSSSSTSTPGSAQGTLLGRASQVPVGQAATFTIPSSGDPGIVVHTVAGQWVAYDAVCPHAGCQVGFASSADVFVCPCHGSQFQVNNGAVLNGPAPRGLTPLKIVEGSNGNLYLQ
ncbi:MAG TPA: Rieske 2Fe-2S domain-containing protein [Acidimicrobiales bacterium]|nr:Rieske 2Fe-2S domain-containing protein [Acidimicrobiales bacterium]